jgi:hypothetical protein
MIYYLSLPSTAARKEIAARLSLPYSDQMQDWEWEVADVGRFGEFLDAYRNAAHDDERFSLMEILIQCVEEMSSLDCYEPAWQAIRSLLLARTNLHRATVQYWACLGETDADAQFFVSRLMRVMLNEGCQ